MSGPSPEEIHDFLLNCHGARKHNKSPITSLFGLPKKCVFLFYLSFLMPAFSSHYYLNGEIPILDFSIKYTQILFAVTIITSYFLK